MIKVHAGLSKKVPIPGVQFSSQEYSAGLEAEIGHGESSEQIKATIRRLYALIAEAIDEQVRMAGTCADPHGAPTIPDPKPAPVRERPAPKPHPNGRHVPATEAQKKCIYAICEALGLQLKDALTSRGLPELNKLGLKQASELIDALKRLETANA